MKVTIAHLIALVAISGAAHGQTNDPQQVPTPTVAELETSRIWLKEQGVLDRVPRFVQGQANDTQFGRQLEDVCGGAAHGALQAREGPHLFNPDWLVSVDGEPKPGQEKAIECLTHAARVAGFYIAPAVPVAH